MSNLTDKEIEYVKDFIDGVPKYMAYCEFASKCFAEKIGMCSLCGISSKNMEYLANILKKWITKDETITTTITEQELFAKIRLARLQLLEEIEERVGEMREEDGSRMFDKLLAIIKELKS